MHSPTAQQKIDLYYAGLSEQTITFAFSDDYHQVDEKLKRYVTSVFIYFVIV